MDENFTFKNLIVWQKAIYFAEVVILMIDELDTNRKHYRLIEQLEAAVTSISMNIAEGKGRFSKKEYKHFLHIARGSLFETISLLNILFAVKWIPKSKLEEMEKKGIEIIKMLNSLIKKIN